MTREGLVARLRLAHLKVSFYLAMTAKPERVVHSLSELKSTTQASRSVTLQYTTKGPPVEVTP